MKKHSDPRRQRVTIVETSAIGRVRYFDAAWFPAADYKQTGAIEIENVYTFEVIARWLPHEFTRISLVNGYGQVVESIEPKANPVWVVDLSKFPMPAPQLPLMTRFYAH